MAGGDPRVDARSAAPPGGLWIRRRVSVGGPIVKTSEIVPISHRALTRLFRMRGLDIESEHRGKRRCPRWPFPGAVELWAPGPDGLDVHHLGTCENISLGGVGMRSDQPFALNQELDVAVHQPELSLHGRAKVRHCTRLRDDYYVGLEFVFERQE